MTLGSPRGPPGSCLPTPQESGCPGSELGWGHEVCSEVTKLGSAPGSRLSASLPVEHFSLIELSISPRDAPRALGGTFHFHALERERATHSSVLAWRIPGMGSLVSCRLWGHTELDTTEMTQQQQSSMATLSPPLKVPDIQHSLVVPKQGCSLEPPMVFF